jgi:hypothetical protein
MLFFGIIFMFAPLLELIVWIPFVGWLIAHGVSFVILIFSFVFSTTVVAMLIGLAWIYYRPVKGIIFFSIAIIGIIIMFFAFPNYK